MGLKNLKLRLHHWIGIWSHWIHLNLVPTHLCVFSKCFWVVSWSHCSHLNSLDKACVAKVLDQKMFFSINQSVTFVKILIRMNVRIYSYQKNYTNEYPNIFILNFLTRTNVRISIRIENCMNIRIFV